MESIVRRAALICATFVLTTFAVPVAAQQTVQNSQSQSVPPAPPPETRNTHRWVNTGGYLTPEPRRKSSTQKAQKKQPKSASSHSKKATHAGKQKDRSAPSVSKAELKRCKGLSSRQLKRNSKCQAALRAQKKQEAQKAKPAAKSLSKDETRRCQKMNYQQLLRNADCAALLQREVEAGKRAKHHSKGKKATGSSKKSAPARDKKHQKSSKRHRS